MDAVKPSIKDIKRSKRSSIIRRTNREYQDVLKFKAVKEDRPKLPFVGSDLPLCQDLFWAATVRNVKDDKKPLKVPTPHPFAYERKNDYRIQTTENIGLGSGAPWSYLKANTPFSWITGGKDTLKSFWANDDAAIDEMEHLTRLAQESTLDSPGKELETSFWQLFATSEPLSSQPSSAITSIQQNDFCENGKIHMRFLKNKTLRSFTLIQDNNIELEASLDHVESIAAIKQEQESIQSKEISTESKDISSQSQNIAAQNQDTIAQNEDTGSRNEDTVAHNEGIAAQIKESAIKSKNVIDKNQGTIIQKENIAIQNEGIITQTKDMFTTQNKKFAEIETNDHQNFKEAIFSIEEQTFTLDDVQKQAADKTNDEQQNDKNAQLADAENVIQQPYDVVVNLADVIVPAVPKLKLADLLGPISEGSTPVKLTDLINLPKRKTATRFNRPRRR
ncbi:hypothetical protein [Parasitella parasitica]|uniref:Uncharacterized protein n=1 Tax=Parasitella parasitica TaxID=35722 RepID=A0A0B7NAI9_9FUNG|nr:hypothetical protein [Parasitella parasitica]